MAAARAETAAEKRLRYAISRITVNPEQQVNTDEVQVDEDEVPPELNDTVVGHEASWDEFAIAPPTEFPELFAFRGKTPVVTMNFGEIRAYGNAGMPTFVYAVPVRVGDKVTVMTNYDLDAYHASQRRPVISMAGSEVRRDKNGRLIGGLELSTYMKMRGRELRLTMPTLHASDLSLMDTVRALLHGAPVGAYAPDEDKRRPQELSIYLDDANGVAHSIVSFDGLNLIVGGAGTGKSIVLAMICNLLGIIPHSFGESGNASDIAYPARFRAIIQESIDEKGPGCHDAWRWASRHDAKVLMKEGWSAALFELVVATAQTFQRLYKGLWVGMNPMSISTATTQLFDGVTSAVIETGYSESEAVTYDPRLEMVLVPVRYTTRRAADRPELTGVILVSKDDIAYGKEHGLLDTEDLETLTTVERRAAAAEQATNITGGVVNTKSAPVTTTLGRRA